MFENYIKQYKDLLNKNFQGIDDTVTLSEIMNLDFPMEILKFIENDIKRWVRKTSSSIFDESKFQSLSDDVLTAIAHNAKIDDEKFDKLLTKSVQSTFNYITRPRTSLLWFTMGSENEASLNDLKEILDYFSDYDYLLSGIRERINVKDLDDKITREDLIELIEDVDNDHVFNISPEQLVDLTNSLFSCYNFHGLEGDEPNREVPLESIIIFFEDKGLGSFIEKLDELIDLDGKESISESDLKVLVDALSDTDNTQNEIDDSDLDIVDDTIEQIDTELSLKEELENEVEDLPDHDTEQINNDFDFEDELEKELEDITAEDDLITDDESSLEQNESLNEVSVEINEEASHDIIEENQEEDFDALADSILNPENTQLEDVDLEIKDDDSKQFIQDDESVAIDEEIDSISENIGIEVTDIEIPVSEELEESEMNDFQKEINSVTKDLV